MAEQERWIGGDSATWPSLVTQMQHVSGGEREIAHHLIVGGHSREGVDLEAEHLWEHVDNDFSRNGHVDRSRREGRERKRKFMSMSI